MTDPGELMHNMTSQPWIRSLSLRSDLTIPTPHLWYYGRQSYIVEDVLGIADLLGVRVFGGL